MAEENKKFRKEVILKIILIVVILFLAITISFLLIQKIKKGKENLLERKLTEKNISAQYDTRIRLVNEYKIVEPYLDKANNFLLNENDIPTIIYALEKLAQDTGNQGSIKTKAETPYKFGSDEGEKIDYTVTLSGNYNTFLEYCKNFENLPFFAKMEYINISGISDVDKNSQMICGVSFFVEKTVKK